MISGRGVSVTIDGSTLLREVDLDVAAGEWVCVLGPNGAGKSTLVRALSGAVHHEGHIEIEGRDAAGLRSRERARLLALVPQSPVIPAGIAVDDYLLLGRTPHLPRFGTEGPADLAAVDAVVDRLHLHDLRFRIRVVALRCSRRRPWTPPPRRCLSTPSCPWKAGC